jgi:plastocyanin
MYMKKVLLIGIVVIIVVAGIGDYFANNNSSSQMEHMPMNTQNKASSTPQATNKVTIEDFAFNSANITVKKGATVTWTNQDSAAHTVTETDSQAGPKSDNLRPGQSYSFTFKAAGTYKYHCLIHPNMTGTVTVTE